MDRSKSLLHFCSNHAYFGDPMPLYANGVYHIYYTARGTQQLMWGHLTTTDFVEFTEQPMTIEPGIAGSLDENGMCTGCVFYENGVFYLFYSAFSSGKFRMMAATSRDGVYFTKGYQELFELNEAWYRNDGTWRDPCVFKDENGKYRMVFCTRRPSGRPDPFPGILGCAESDDLIHWTLLQPIDLGHISGAPECPDVFRLGEKWALVYYWHDTRIRLSDTSVGPWQRAKVLSPNHLDFMAAKTMSNGKRRILVGWIPRKDCDCSERIWGGNMAIPRELYAGDDDSPACRFIEEVGQYFEQRAEGLSLNAADTSYGSWTAEDSNARLENGFVYWADTPNDFRLRFRLTAVSDNTVVVLFLRLSGSVGDCFGTVSQGYQLIFDFPVNALRIREHYEWDQRPDLAWIPLGKQDNKSVLVDFVVEGDILEAVVNDRQSLVYRLMKSVSSGYMGLLVSDGTANIEGWCAEEMRD